MQISEEEKKSIEEIRNWRNYIVKNRKKVNRANDIEFHLRTVLNLIEKQNKEIEIKDKMIDEMAELFLTMAKDIPGTIYHYLEKNGFSIEQCSPCNKQEKQTCADCFKQHFRKKVENG